MNRLDSRSVVGMGAVIHVLDLAPTRRVLFVTPQATTSCSHSATAVAGIYGFAVRIFSLPEFTTISGIIQQKLRSDFMPPTVRWWLGRAAYLTQGGSTMP